MYSGAAHTARGNPSNAFHAEVKGCTKPYQSAETLVTSARLARSSRPATSPPLPVTSTETNKTREFEKVRQESLFKELIEDIFYSIELSSAEHTHGHPLEDFKKYITENLKKKIEAARGASFLLELENTAKRRVKEWIAEREEEDKVKNAREELQEALDLMSGLHGCLKKANDDGEALSGSARKRKVDEAVAQLDKAAAAAKRIKREDNGIGGWNRSEAD